MLSAICLAYSVATLSDNIFYSWAISIFSFENRWSPFPWAMPRAETDLFTLAKVDRALSRSFLECMLLKTDVFLAPYRSISVNIAHSTIL